MYSEMPTFTNQMRVKRELNFAEWANQLVSWRALSLPQVGSRAKGPASLCYLGPLVLYCKILFGEQIGKYSKAFLINKLTYKLLSYASAPCIHPSFLISVWLTTIVSPVSALFCRRMPEKVNLSVKTAHYLMKNNICIKQHWRVTYIGYILDETVSGESIVHKVISKVNLRLKFLYRKNKYLTPNLRRLLCNVLIRPHFDYACSTWYPNLSKKN